MNATKLLGIKTAMTLRETEALKRVVWGKSVIEIGALFGYATIQMARVARSVVSVDPHDGYPFYNPTPTLAEFRHNIERWGVAGLVTPVVATAQQAMQHLRGADVAFIDCTGLYKDTKFCLRHVPANVIACHDFGRPGCEGVTNAVIEFAARQNRNFTVTETLAIIE